MPRLRKEEAAETADVTAVSAPERKYVPATVLHMRPALAKAIVNLYEAWIPRPALTPAVQVGDRLFLVEWAGASTGRADSVVVLAVEPDRILIDRRFCWHRGKHDTDLTMLGMWAREMHVPILEAL